MAATTHHASECPAEPLGRYCHSWSRPCAGCGELMHATRSDARTASPACRQQLARDRRRRRSGESVTPS